MNSNSESARRVMDARFNVRWLKGLEAVRVRRRVAWEISAIPQMDLLV